MNTERKEKSLQGGEIMVQTKPQNEVLQMQFEKQLNVTSSEDEGDTGNTAYVMTMKVMIFTYL